MNKRVPTRRFVIQRSVAVKARDRSNRQFLLTELWRDVGSTRGNILAAQTFIAGFRIADPKHTFRAVEDRGDRKPRVVIAPNR